ncbi:MAG: Gfo/Idh/MocA family oxidoreductase [Gemmatimonadota bacterium]
MLARRTFVAGLGGLGLGALVLPRRILGGGGFQAASDTLNVAIVGAGGMGMSNAEALVSQNIVALCDVDFGYVHRSLTDRLKPDRGKVNPETVKVRDQFTKAKRYADFRRMLEQKNIDGVVIATPDHLHAVIAKAAMEAGKHVYVQKPLTYTVHEARVLRDTARRTGVKTQMGNQGHSSNDARLINEWIQAGVIGPVHQVQVWTNRPIWAQGVPRPKPLAAPKPPGLRWDLYLGPVKEDVPYNPAYHPFSWRGWVDFGGGALGDMGAHLIDHPYWALRLTQPTSVEATSSPWGGSAETPVTYPLATVVHYDFAARGSMPPVKLSWYDGGLMPPRPRQLPDSVELEREGGVFFLGEKGILMHETYGSKPRIWPEALMAEAQAVPKSIPRIETSHELNWVAACKGNATESSPIDYAARLTETMLLGIVALRTGQGKKILYDADNMRITNRPEANQYLTREYRAGWAV